MAGRDSTKGGQSQEGVCADEVSGVVTVLSEPSSFDIGERSPVDTYIQCSPVPIASFNVVAMIKTHEITSGRSDRDFWTRQSCVLVGSSICRAVCRPSSGTGVVGPWIIMIIFVGDGEAAITGFKVFHQ